jgi:hypothetical protein
MGVACGATEEEEELGELRFYEMQEIFWLKKKIFFSPEGCAQYAICFDLSNPAPIFRLFTCVTH